MGEGVEVSNAGDILTALTADIEAAVSGVTVGLVPITFDDLASRDLPYCVLLMVDNTAEALDWGQEQRTWTIAGQLAQSGGTREQMQTKLEAIRDQIFADRTLGSSVDKSTFASLVPYSHIDDPLIYGEFSVSAEKVA
jgi:hypothetical protein